VEILNCPSRRRAIPYPYSLNGKYRPYNSDTNHQFVALSDYAGSAGDRGSYGSTGPSSMAVGDNPSSSWNLELDTYTGVIFTCSEIQLSQIRDGTSNTFLIGEKHVDPIHYLDGKDAADDAAMYQGASTEVLRWTYDPDYTDKETGLTAPLALTPLQDLETMLGYRFGSAHAAGVNMAFCDGSVHLISYTIDAETFRCLSNREDGLILQDNAY